MADKEEKQQHHVEKEAEDAEDSSVAAGAAGAGDDEDTGAQVAPIVKLDEVAVTTGEEEEDVLLDMKSKLYRYDNEGNQWKERGTGTVKLLKHKESGKVRLVMRQAKTLKICANHLVAATTKMTEHVGNEKSCVWHATDFSDGELKDETFAIRFGSIENCNKFKNVVHEIAESLAKNEGTESKDDSSTAALLEKLSVSESQSEASVTTEVPTTATEKEDGKEGAPSE